MPDHRTAIVTGDDIETLAQAVAAIGSPLLAEHIRKPAEAIIQRLRDTLAAYEPAAVEAASSQYEREGEIEIDEGAVCSRGETGVYVVAWVWVADETTDEDE